MSSFCLPPASFFGRDAGFEAWQNAFIISYVQLRPLLLITETCSAIIKQHTAPDVQNLRVYFTP
jgi:hypothetical protein